MPVQRHRAILPGKIYIKEIVPVWLPALDGVVDKLTAGARLADVGCGHGVSTLVMARAFPNSEFVGFDFHRPSIDRARAQATEAGLDNVRFAVGSAKDYAGERYDVIAFFDCLHDMGDPVGACQYARKSMQPDGTLMVVEPFANDKLEDNIPPIGRIAYAASTCVCTPASLAQDVGLGLGAQAGPDSHGDRTGRLLALPCGAPDDERVGIRRPPVTAAAIGGLLVVDQAYTMFTQHVRQRVMILQLAGFQGYQLRNRAGEYGITVGLGEPRRVQESIYDLVLLIDCAT